MKGTPLNYFKATGLASTILVCAFRRCFICVYGDPTNPGHIHAVRYADMRVQVPPEALIRRLRRAATLPGFVTPVIPSLVAKHAGTAPDAQPGLHLSKAPRGRCCADYR